MPLKSILLNYLNLNSNWVHGGECERLAMSNQFKASNASRRLREMYKVGLIERRLDEKGRVWYKSVKREEVKPNPVFSPAPLFELKRHYK